MTARPVFIIGAMKAGTSALTDALGRHSEMLVPWIPEPGYYYWRTHAAPTGPGDERATSMRIYDGAGYSALHEAVPDRMRFVDGSTVHYRSPDALRSIAAEHPDAHVIFVLRDPANRALSAYRHLRRDGRETLSFADALAAEPNRVREGWEPLWHYRGGSDYLSPLKQLATLIPPDRLHVVFFEQLVDSPRDVLEQLQLDIGVGIDSNCFRLDNVNSSGAPRSRWLYRRFSASSANQLKIKSALPPAVVTAARSIRNRLLLNSVESDEDISGLVTEMAPMVKAIEALGYPVLDHWPSYRCGSDERP